MTLKHLGDMRPSTVLLHLTDVLPKSWTTENWNFPVHAA